jgi:hypothetical protein
MKVCREWRIGSSSNNNSNSNSLFLFILFPKAAKEQLVKYYGSTEFTSLNPQPAKQNFCEPIIPIVATLPNASFSEK